MCRFKGLLVAAWVLSLWLTGCRQEFTRPLELPIDYSVLGEGKVYFESFRNGILVDGAKQRAKQIPKPNDYAFFETPALIVDNQYLHFLYQESYFDQASTTDLYRVDLGSETLAQDRISTFRLANSFNFSGFFLLPGSNLQTPFMTLVYGNSEPAFELKRFSSEGRLVGEVLTFPLDENLSMGLSFSQATISADRKHIGLVINQWDPNTISSEILLVTLELESETLQIVDRLNESINGGFRQVDGLNFSPDGSTLSYLNVEITDRSELELVLVPLENPSEKRAIQANEINSRNFGDYQSSWLPDGQGLLLSDGFNAIILDLTSNEFTPLLTQSTDDHSDTYFFTRVQWLQ